MNVLYLTNIPSPYRVAFFEQLGRLVQLTVLYERKSASNRDKQWVAESAKYFTEIYLEGINSGTDGAVCPGVFRHLSNKVFDYVIVGGYSTPTGMLSVMYLRWKCIPFILNIDGGFIKSETRLKKLIKSYFIGSALAWLSPSRQTDEYIMYYGAQKNMIYRYPFTSLYQKDIMDDVLSYNDKIRMKEKLGVNSKFLIVSVGRFIYGKGFDILIKAATHLTKEAEIWLIGGGEEFEIYEKLIKKHQASNVRLVPFMIKNDLMKYYDAADVFVLPTRSDVWGLVINEAMARGLPVVTTDNCGAGLELVQNGVNGYIVPKEDVDALAHSISKILENDEIRYRMGQESLRKIKRYTFSEMASRHYQILDGLKNNGGTRNG